MTETLVMKFGGAAVETPKDFSRIASIIAAMKVDYPQIIVVLSAMGNTTNELIALAKEVNPSPPQREYDMLITVGERISISLLAMALAMKGLNAVSFTGSQSGIITTVDHTNAKIIDVRPRRLKEQLERGNVVIVAGFQGVSQNGEITTLGRGGSDTTAVALAAAFKSKRVIFYKDVPGIFNSDPKADKKAERYSSLTYDEAQTIINSGARVLHSRSIELAEKNRIMLEVRSFFESDSSGTVVFNEGDHQDEPLFETGDDASLLMCRSGG